jgi:hypothetical protein
MSEPRPTGRWLTRGSRGWADKTDLSQVMSKLPSDHWAREWLSQRLPALEYNVHLRPDEKVNVARKMLQGVARAGHYANLVARTNNLGVLIKDSFSKDGGPEKWWTDNLWDRRHIAVSKEQIDAELASEMDDKSSKKGKPKAGGAPAAKPAADKAAAAPKPPAAKK